MRLKLIYVLAFCVGITACKTQEKNDTTAQTPELEEMSRFAEAKIGVGDASTFQLAVTESSLLNAATKFIMESNDGNLVSYTYKIETIDGNRFLRLYREDGKITTIAIDYNSEKGAYYTGNTICTSSSSSKGCIPDGKACSKIENTDATGQCTKTSIAFYDDDLSKEG
ncbi:hypothetical protein [Nonlabens agnitus]|uniref:Lipoprotein n=1 Tax=Nonlabens agnitus TaxID=870484 RepID=A0A2S9WVU5_9FLAO|nr:hypothetical protein [Nonlabens agnitus]PRP67607.1 hypothetical protein BST86_11135 [Nonlabens agnitus]